MRRLCCREDCRPGDGCLPSYDPGAREAFCALIGNRSEDMKRYLRRRGDAFARAAEIRPPRLLVISEYVVHARSFLQRLQEDGSYGTWSTQPLIVHDVNQLRGLKPQDVVVVIDTLEPDFATWLEVTRATVRRLTSEMVATPEAWARCMAEADA